tara:strand:- start:3453 stop:4469 length:1017 start_codon:yes stop_codon:yes gene_type:complete
MQFNSVQSGSFLTGAKSVNDNVTDIYDTAIKTGFAADQVIMQANANDAVKQVAAARRQASMANAGIGTYATAKVQDMKAKLPGQLKDIWRPAVRMEGINRMAGSVAAGAYIMDESKLQQKEAAALKEERDRYRKAMETISEQNSAFFKEEQELRRLKIEQLRNELNLPSPTNIQDSSTNPNSTPNTFSTPGTSNTSSPVLPSNANSNNSNPTPKQVFDYMKSLGVSDVHAKGILANIKGESNFQTGVMGDGGKSGGLFQMYKDRYAKMVNAVPDWKTNWKGQIVHGLKDDRAPEYLKIKFDSPVQAANWFLHNYERPAKEHRPGREKLNESFIGNLNF